VVLRESFSQNLPGETPSIVCYLSRELLTFSAWTPVLPFEWWANPTHPIAALGMFDLFPLWSSKRLARTNT
jgi:hypothetical protein